jgi:hypothetical protein
MKFRSILIAGAALGVILPTVLIIGCGDREIVSRWYDRPITIDGIDAGNEWDNARNYFDDKKVTLGVVNGADTVYVRVSTTDLMMQRQILMSGLTVWFDEHSGRNKKIGVHFPVGVRGGESQMPGIDVQGEGASLPGRNLPPGVEDVQAQIQKLIDASQMTVELIGPGQNDRTTESIVDVRRYGIQCKLGYAKGSLVYELQIPLMREESCPCGISLKRAGAFGLGLETGQTNSSNMRQQSQGMGRGGDAGGYGGLRGGGMGGFGGGTRGGGRSGGGQGAGTGYGSSNMTEPLEFWLKIWLSPEH